MTYPRSLLEEGMHVGRERPRLFEPLADQSPLRLTATNACR